ncbi:MAG: glycoside hydrolase family 2 TIM barrel-domain containing protein, partial [Pyrinomonadaceae bacterium]
ITLRDHGSSGVHVTTPQVSAARATVHLRGTVVNSSSQDCRIEVTSTVVDGEGRNVAEMKSAFTTQAKVEANFEQASTPVARPQLWSPEHPYLYTVHTVVRANGRAVDEVVNPLGFRWFSFDAERGFFLNGKHLKLRGTNRHQDYAGMGNAVPDALHVRDLEIIKGTGFNFLRLAHYPQDASVLEAADRLGLIIWEEIPIVNQITLSTRFNENSKQMLTEMIRQHRNHPSVVLWGYMNEVFLRAEKTDENIRGTVALARALEAICRREDPDRVTAIAFDQGARDLYYSSGLGEVTQVVGWNLYHGWYYEEFSDFGKFIDEQHRRFSRRPLIISEYGANGDTRLHSLKPKRYDSTIEWQRRFHEAYLPQINARPFIAGSAVWNQFDFGSEFRGETIPHINQKGLLTFDRRPKDTHYFYKAHFSRDPVLHIATADWQHRTGTNEIITGFGFQPVRQTFDVYTNLAVVELRHDDVSLGQKTVRASRRVSWDVPLHDGSNVLIARGTHAGRTVYD